VRSRIAARWAARLGYTRVIRYPPGYQEWMATGAGGQGPGSDASRDQAPWFPDLDLVEVDGTDRTSLREFVRKNVVVVLFNDLCTECVRQLDVFEGVVDRLPPETQAIRVGVFSSEDGVHRILAGHAVGGPLYLTERTDLLHRLGEHELPLTYVLRKNKAGDFRVLLVLRGVLEDPNGFVDEVRELVH
jgi:hypothetical protein